MTTAEIIGLVSAIAAAIAAIVAALSCMLHFISTLPRIKIILKDAAYNCYKENPNKYAALLSLEINNFSPVGGTLSNVTLIYRGREYYAETIGSNYQSPFQLMPDITSNASVDPEAYRLKIPYCVKGYSCTLGYFFFPDFPAQIDRKGIIADVHVTLITSRLKIKRFKKVIFFNDTFSN